MFETGVKLVFANLAVQFFYRKGRNSLPSGVSGLVFCLFFEWCSRERPSEGLCQCFVEIIDKRQYPLSHRLQRVNTTSLQQPTTQNTKPNLHLIQPRTMLRRISS